MSRRRRGGGPQLVTIYWRDIPAQVNASSDDGKHQAMLSPRFQHAIDRAAGVAGLTDTDSYVQQWRRVSAPFEGDPTTAADDEVARLEVLVDQAFRLRVDRGGHRLVEPGERLGLEEHVAFHADALYA